jgi:hypothetical protein
MLQQCLELYNIILIKQRRKTTRKLSRVSADCLHIPEKLCAYKDEQVRKKRKKEEKRKMKKKKRNQKKVEEKQKIRVCKKIVNESEM